MPLGDPVDVKPIKSFHHGLVRPTQIVVPWVKIIDNTGVDTADNSGSVIDDPDVQITNLTTHILKVGRAGTKLRLRVRYDDGITSFSTPPVFNVFGRNSIDDAAQPWQRLVNLNGNADISIPQDNVESMVDVFDGETAKNQYTHVHPADHTLDLDGCDEVIVGVHTAVAVGAGDKDLVSLWAKVI